MKTPEEIAFEVIARNGLMAVVIGGSPLETLGFELGDGIAYEDAMRQLVELAQQDAIESMDFEYAYGVPHVHGEGFRIHRAYQSLKAFIAAGYNYRGLRRRVGPWEPVNKQGNPAGARLR